MRGHQVMAVWLAALAAVPGAGRAAAAPVRAALYGEVSRFAWEERLPEEGLRVEEDGPLYGVAGSLAIPASAAVIEARGRFFAGDVDYDGYIQYGNGTFTPARSSTDYVGMGAEGDVGLPLGAGGRPALMPFGGAGIRMWERELGGGESEFGYREYWYTLYGLLGIALEWPAAGEGGLGGFLRAALCLPLDNRARYEFDGRFPDTEVEPGRDAGWTAEAGVAAGRFRGALFAERQQFGKSDTDSRTGRLYQPESESLTVGVRLGVGL